MDQLTWVDYVAVGVAVVAAVFAGVEAWNARGARRDASAASTAAEAALTAIAELMKEQSEAQTFWEAESQGGGRFKWDLTNRTGKTVTARLEFPDQDPGHRLEATARNLTGTTLEPGESLEFKWERRGTTTGRVAHVKVLWSTEGDRERVTRVRLRWPETVTINSAHW